MASVLALSTLLGLALAQTTTMQVPYPEGYDSEFAPIVASVVTADSASTVISMYCVEGTDGNDCGIFPFQTLTYGPSTWKLDMSVPGDAFTMTQDCSWSGKSAVCTESASGEEANFPGKSTETYESGTMLVTVTAGADKLKNAAKATPAASGSESVPAMTTAATGSAATQTLATVTQSGSTQASGTPAEATGAATANVVTLGRGLVGAGVGLLAVFL
jgi:hypothetical protein